ncbi:tautomerase family protein [Thiolinea disciformis]|uniref:tautomerase family protein n=1 Tax=Thiolinea disciformis TaxID=125614 RepID=UPI0024801FA2|nr:tautomerase family protein [Thiolinea disciformis]
MLICKPFGWQATPKFWLKRSKDACVIEVVFLRGRTDEQKRALFRHVAEQAVQSGFRTDDIMIALVENSRMDWSLGLGIAYADHHSETSPK